MPELPEVETIVQRLRNLVVGKTIGEVLVRRSKSFLGDISTLKGQPILELSRRSKLIRFHLPSNQNLLVHLKMTGQLIYVDQTIRVGGGHPTADWVRELPSTFTRVEIPFLERGTLYFNDQRVFGWIRQMSDEYVAHEFAKLGPDANSPDFSFAEFAAQISRRKMPIKPLLMDNSIVAGVGNIYACDALHAARLSPWRPGTSLSPTELRTLYDSTRQVIARGIELKGATIHSFSHVDGFAGGYQLEARVYGRAGMPCLSCGSIIEKSKLAGRGTYFCPECQSVSGTLAGTESGPSSAR